MHSITHGISQGIKPAVSGSFRLPAVGMQTITSIFAIRERLKALTPRDLLVLDVDDVLFTPKDRVLRGSHSHFDHPMHRIYTMRGEEQKYWYSLCYSQAHYQEVESGVSQLIQDVQRANVPVIAITAFETPSYGIVEDTVAVRLAELNQFDYDFGSSENCEAYMLDILEDGSHPVVAAGVIFSCLKGPALRSYLHKNSMHCERIVIIDDIQSNLDSILCNFPASAECYHLTAASMLPGTLTNEQERFQVDHFLRTKNWLSEDAIKCLFPQDILGEIITS